MNPSFLNDITTHKSKWDSLPLIEHIGLIRGYMLVCNQDCFGRTSQAWARKQLADCLDNFIFACDETEPAKPGNFARRYK